MASVYQPTPVFGGKAWTMPLTPLTPVAMSFAYVGMSPLAAYVSIRSGRMPSAAKKTTFAAAGLAGGAGAFAATTPAGSRPARSAATTSRRSGRERLTGGTSETRARAGTRGDPTPHRRVTRRHGRTVRPSGVRGHGRTSRTHCVEHGSTGSAQEVVRERTAPGVESR